ncbi:3-phosphoserine/phosphohydroxythreonine transaminase [Campylobacter sp. RM12637]|uniref:3-phosphoserine/phosphohydroxythreonine transaminase n=1 Tax=Campylobacter sp. RM12637 TaxID=2735734 RepID=UPI00301577BD|nr:3-phosphoserine/phosphohydroxythreonine transaminase [Campylobacter sp. RM12637]
MRQYNFSAGPSELPLEVLKEIQEELLSYKNNGFSIMEISHRSSYYEQMHNDAIKDAKELYGINDDYEVIFVQGGATMQFSLLAMNFSLDNKPCEYIDTDVWTQKACEEAILAGVNAKIVASSKDSKYNYIPKIALNNDSSYTYICSNNTVHGTQYKQLPISNSPLIVDASSDFFSKKLDFSNIGVLYGGVQKNAGIAGFACLIIRKDLLERSKNKTMPKMFNYNTYADNNSLFNTPPTFAIYVYAKIMKWIKAKGGLDVINQENEIKAKYLYDIIDNSNFYKAYVNNDDRSVMNVCFTTGNDELDLEFWSKAAKEHNMLGLKGHKKLGGLRASIYNSASLEKVKILGEYMKEYERVRG